MAWPQWLEPAVIRNFGGGDVRGGHEAPFRRRIWALALVSRGDGLSAVTMPWRSIYVLREHWHDRELRRHELVHIAQIERLGPLRFSSLYLFYLARCGYRDNPLEKEAFGDPKRGSGALRQ
jgi:hypothetical protein